MAESQAKKTILLVDDDSIFLKMQEILIKRNGYETITAFSGEQAVSIAREGRRIDLILMDIDLGRGMDGTEAAELIIKERDIPVLFLSSHSEPEIVEKTEKITSYGYVVKNSAETVLMASIKMAFKLYNAHRCLKERETVLLESKNLFLEFMKYLPGFAYIKDPERNLLFVNENLADSFGIPAEEWIGKKDEEIWPGEFCEKIKVTDEQVLSTRNPVFTEEIVPLKGVPRSYYTIKFPIPRTGLLPLLGGISLDITDRKEIEDALSFSEIKFSAAFMSNPEPMAISDVQTSQVLEVNPAYTKLSGYSREEILGQSSIELDLWLNPHERENILKGLLSGKQVDNREIQVKTKDGSIKDLMFSTKLFNMKDKTYLLSVAHDMTQMKKIQKELSFTQEIFRLFMEYSPIYVFFKDEEIRAIQLSKNYEQMLGRPMSELLGKTMDDLFPSELAKSMIEDDKKILREGKMIEVEEELDGKIYNTIKFPIKRDGFPMWLAGFTIDITRQKTAERLLSQALDEKKALLRELQHRIKNSLNLITGILGLENSQVSDLSVKNVLNGINSRILSLADLYTCLYQTDSFKEVRLNEYFRQVIFSIKKTFLDKNQKIEIEMELEEMMLEFNLATTLGLVLNEVLTNALKYAFPNNKKGQILILLRKENSNAVLEIINNGIPLPEDFNVSHSSGIGLVLVQMMAEQLKGTLTYQTVKNKNENQTIFRIQFPYDEVKKSEKNSRN